MQKFLDNLFTLVLMNLRTPFVAGVFAIVTLVSCASPQKMILLQDQKADNARVQEVVKSMKMQESTYKLRPGDRVMLTLVSLTDERINFIKEPEMELVVDGKGQIELPVIGMVEIAGLTMREAEEKIKRTASEFLKTPTARLKLLNFTYTVLGEVGSQGSYIAPEPKVNILQALGQAGGFTENANRETIRIIRNENGTARIYQMNLLEDNSISSANFFLQPNDIVLVNPVRSTALRQERFAMFGLGMSIISSVSFIIWQIVQNR